MQPLGAVSVSIRIACFTDDGVDAGSLMRLADRALYSARRAGRDRFVVAGDAAAVADGGQGDRPRLKTLVGV